MNRIFSLSLSLSLKKKIRNSSLGSHPLEFSHVTIFFLRKKKKVNKACMRCRTWAPNKDTITTYHFDTRINSNYVTT